MVTHQVGFFTWEDCNEAGTSRPRSSSDKLSERPQIEKRTRSTTYCPPTLPQVHGSFQQDNATASSSSQLATAPSGGLQDSEDALDIQVSAVSSVSRKESMSNVPTSVPQDYDSIASLLLSPHATAGTTPKDTLSHGPSSDKSSVPPRYKPLVQILEKCVVEGQKRPRRSYVALKLKEKYPSVYKVAGVDGWTQYAVGAEQAGIINLGGISGAAWVSLASDISSSKSAFTSSVLP